MMYIQSVPYHIGLSSRFNADIRTSYSKKIVFSALRTNQSWMRSVLKYKFILVVVHNSKILKFIEFSLKNKKYKREKVKK